MSILIACMTKIEVLSRYIDFRKLDKEAYIFILWWAQGKESLRIRNLKRRIVLVFRRQMAKTGMLSKLQVSSIAKLVAEK